MIRQAAILCGGPRCTTWDPKPLLPVGGIPFLDVLVFELARHCIGKILLLAGVGARRIIEYATSTPLKERFGLDIVVSVESKPASTGGARWHACDRLEDRFFLLNRDPWLDVTFA